jgi:two-component system sensor histidine kinase/response regulator
MINDLLLLAKMQSGKMILNCVDVDLNTLVEKAFSEFVTLAATKDLQLKMQLTKPSCTISGDANLLRRVLDNLLSNAIKFSPKGTTITLKVDYLADQRGIIQLADQGVGIKADLKQRIFDKYEVGNLMSGVAQLGLGLAFCKMVVEAHGGTIVVEDNQPRGAIFTVVL